MSFDLRCTLWTRVYGLLCFHMAHLIRSLGMVELYKRHIGYSRTIQETYVVNMRFVHLIWSKSQSKPTSLTDLIVVELILANHNI